MAAYAALASLMNNIEQMINHPFLSNSIDRNQIQQLMEKAGFLLDFIEGYTHHGVEELEREITRAAHAAEDAIESHIVDQIHAGTNQASLTYLIHLQRIIEDMDPIVRKASQLKEKEGLRVEQPPTHSRTLMETEEIAMVGFEDELYQLKDRLISDQSSRRIISIVGMGGTGKTTLAKNVYENSLIKQHFDIRACATISLQYSAREILSQLLSIHGNSYVRDVDKLGLELHKTLSGRRYLIVLDDLWSVEAWDEVRRFFPDNGNRSRVIFTTRLLNVATDSGSEYCIRMKPLDEHNSWKLFCNKAFGQEDCPYPDLENVGKEISRLCRGLPLSTVVVGGLLLKSPRSLELWENIAFNILSVPDSKVKEESLDILSLSYNHLLPHLKPCFLYMGVFEEDSNIRVSKIINLWVAEGVIRPNKTSMLEEIAKSYLQELIDRNLILVMTHRRNGKIGSCGIHDLVRDLCLKVGEQQEFFNMGKGKIGRTERRIVSFFIQDLELPLARSMISRNILSNSPEHKLLRVRIIPNSVIDLPKEIYDSVNLRYLEFRRNVIQSVLWLPLSSLSLNWNLQTLNIIIEASWSHALVVAPIEIWKMQQLRHVKCPKIYLPTDGLPLVDFMLSEKVCEMIPNIKKLHLIYQRSLHGYEGGLIECVPNIHRLHKLESLKLSIVGSSRLVIESGVNKKLAFPASLNKLLLSGCQLRWEDLWKIGSLPELKVLELGISSVMVGNKWSLVDGQFLRLRFLKIDWCNLHCWEADSSHFPVLETLILSGLRHLEEIPSGIGEIPTLEFIHVEYCTESAAISAVRIKENHLKNQGDDALRIQLKIPCSEVESFKEKVEAEELTLDNVQLERLGRTDP